MLAVGTLGTTYIGTLQASKEIEVVTANATIAAEVPAIFQDGELTVLEDKTVYEIIHYKTISEDRLSTALADLPSDKKAQVEESIQEVRAASKQGALTNMCIFPASMLAGYALLGLYFKSRGGYQAEQLD